MFIDKILLPHTPVKQQSATASCWAFAMCSYWETELAMENGANETNVEFSPWYLARHRIERLSAAYLRKSPLTQDSFPTGDVGQTAVKLSARQGMVYLQDYLVGASGHYENYRKMIRQIKLLVLFGQITRFTRNWCLHRISHLLDRFWGILPDESKILHPALPVPVFYTSFNHLPFQEEVILPLADNYSHAKFLNVPLDELILKMKDTLVQGHSIVWEGCIVGGFSAKNGVARLKEGIAYDEDSRSEAFRKGGTTDDHIMHIIGLAHDESGNTYFIAKNSIGEIGPYRGLIYMDERYVRLKTIAVAF